MKENEVDIVEKDATFLMKTGAQITFQKALIKTEGDTVTITAKDLDSTIVKSKIAIVIEDFEEDMPEIMPEPKTFKFDAQCGSRFGFVGWKLPEENQYRSTKNDLITVMDEIVHTSISKYVKPEAKEAPKDAKTGKTDKK